jgi:hypothetical protein
MYTPCLRCKNQQCAAPTPSPRGTVEHFCAHRASVHSAIKMLQKRIQSILVLLQVATGSHTFQACMRVALLCWKVVGAALSCVGRGARTGDAAR